MMNQMQGQFRFAYFTDKYQETYEFYLKWLGLDLAHDWDRNEHDKGAVFKAGGGLIEIMLRPEGDEYRYQGLDYRISQGAFMVIQVSDVDELFNKYQSKGIPFKQEIVSQPWGHRSFSVLEPNGLILFFFEEQFKA
ncbi:VOC family protein [Lutimonas zeaxanthinifaciens]|uniref:VOC family protein n=1 Tax=Lutimonas zeaxanthinifaciens TaxID=3060215 RepID=UPI00265D5701|nr:VOC family protein [Lutimonas sp. YSD2104]WKK67147.1 VOC family protein [Lutimonas sp. YSD2104]